MQFSSVILTTIVSALASTVSAEREVTVLEPKAKRDVTIPDYAKNFKGTTYTPFDQNKNCRTEEQIKTDIGYLSSYSLLRLYSNDCNVVQYAAEAFPGKLIVAVNDVSSKDAISGELYGIATSIGKAGREFNDAVDTVVVGNELVYNSWYSAADVGNFISQARSIFPAFPGKWISADTVSSFYGNPELCGYNDYIGINNHPFFDNQSAEQAGDYVLSHIEAVAAFCSEHGHDKKVVTLETGWPWKGKNYGPAYPTPENQVTALTGIAEKAGDDCIVFSAYNELWKDDSVWAVEKNWGFLGNDPSAW